MDQWKNGWMNVLIDEWIDEWMHSNMTQEKQYSSSSHGFGFMGRGPIEEDYLRYHHTCAIFFTFSRFSPSPSLQGPPSFLHGPLSFLWGPPCSIWGPPSSLWGPLRPSWLPLKPSQLQPSYILRSYFLLLNEWMDEFMNERLNEWMNEWMNLKAMRTCYTTMLFIRG